MFGVRKKMSENEPMMMKKTREKIAKETASRQNTHTQVTGNKSSVVDNIVNGNDDDNDNEEDDDCSDC